MDRDLVTSIDRQRKEDREKSIKKQIREQRKQAIQKIRQERGKWSSTRSELISYAKMLCDYFSYVNQGTEEIQSYQIFDHVQKKMEKFCS